MNLAPLRYHVLVDVFNGKCYFPDTPDINSSATLPQTNPAIDASYTGLDVELDTTVKEIFASIDHFTQD